MRFLSLYHPDIAECDQWVLKAGGQSADFWVTLCSFNIISAARWGLKFCTYSYRVAQEGTPVWQIMQ